MDNNNYELKTDPFICCCVCFSDNNIIYNNHTKQSITLDEIQTSWFENEIIPDNILILNQCLNHYICIDCLRKITHNFENHPINNDESHIYCPYPFEKCQNELEFRYIFEHSHIKKICRTDKEWSDYISHAEEFAFPGFTCLYYVNGENQICNSDILVETEEFKSTPIGQLVLTCNQNISCMKRFCYNCKKTMSFYHHMCYNCSTIYENENPNVFNYYINKNQIILDIPLTSRNTDEFEFDVQSKYNPEDYLYYNKDITPDIAIQQIKDVIENYESYMICPICKISLFKTEKCNGLSHHNVERCYICGRIGYKIKGLGEHWNSDGCNGCFRFDSDTFVRHSIPEYNCSDLTCHGHDRGECTVIEHQNGIDKLIDLRKASTVLHIITSLLPQIRFDVYDKIYEHYIDDTVNQKFIPFKQTLVLLDKFKERSRDCSEQVIYSKLQLEHPLKINLDKNTTISCDDYIFQYSILEEETGLDYDIPILPSINQMRTWRNTVDSELQPLLERQRRMVHPFQSFMTRTPPRIENIYTELTDQEEPSEDITTNYPQLEQNDEITSFSRIYTRNLIDNLINTYYGVTTNESDNSDTLENENDNDNDN